MCVHIFWNLLLLQNAKPTLNIQRAITNQKEINELLNRKKLTNGILSPSINSDVSYNYKYEYIYTNGIYPFIYCCVTNLPKTKWLNTIIVLLSGIFGLARCWQKPSAVTCLQVNWGFCTWLGLAGAAQERQLYFIFLLAAVGKHRSVLLITIKDEQKQAEISKTSCGQGWNSQTITSASFYYPKQVMWARFGEIPFTFITGRTEKSHIKEYEYIEAERTEAINMT